MQWRLFKIYYAFRKLVKELGPRKDLCQGENLFDNADAVQRSRWIFHDEKWSRIINRFDHRRVVARGFDVVVDDDSSTRSDEVLFCTDGEIVFDAKTKTLDEWLYLHLENTECSFEDFRWEFEARRDSDFREFQFGFRYKNFYNRYRYRFEDSHIFFDKICFGRPYQKIGSSKFNMEIGTWYKIQITAFKNRFTCHVDGKLFMTDYDFENSFPKGSIAIILWESGGKIDIKACVRSIRVNRIYRC